MDCENETELAKVIEAGRIAAQTLGDNQALDPSTRRSLRGKVKAGQAASEQLLIQSQGLIEKCLDRISVSAESRKDLRQEAQLGLLRAIDRFDWRRGVSFSGYAYFWVYQAISRAEPKTDDFVHLPDPVVQLLRKIERTRYRLQSVSGEEISPEELAEACELDLGRLLNLLNYARLRSFESLDGRELGWVIDVVGEPDPPSPYEEMDMQAEMRVLLGHLADLERMVMEMRFGIGRSRPSTLDEVAAALGVTRERVRQIEQKAFAKIRAKTIDSQRLRELLED